MKKYLLTFVALITIVTLCVGCSSSSSDNNESFFSEGIRKAGDKITNLFGGHSLTKDNSLEGKRIFGEDEYTGTYEVAFEQFSGREILFGGASLDGSEGKTIQITYTANIKSGSVEVFWNTADSEEQQLFEGQGEQTTTIELQGGWEYLSLEGDALEGNIRIEIE